MSDLVLILTPNDPRNTCITDQSGQTLYKTVTGHDDKEGKTVTRLQNADGKVIAALEWGTGSPDRITPPGERQKSMVEWLKKSSNPLSRSVFLYDDQGRKYKWKGLEPNHKLELIADDVKGHESIVCHFEPGSTDAQSAQLMLTSRAVELQDLVVTSFLFLEKEKRFPHKAGTHRFINVGPLGVLAAALSGASF